MNDLQPEDSEFEVANIPDAILAVIPCQSTFLALFLLPFASD